MEPSFAKRFKRWSPRGRRLAYARSRAQVERLEDRVLLSAEPMLQQTRPDTGKEISADNVSLNAVERKTIEVDLAQFEPSATIVDLTKGASQNSRLSGAGDLLSLSGEVRNLIVDLSATDNKVTLGTEPDGRLRVTADGLYDLLFAKPTGLFAIRGQGGADQVVVKTADLGEAMLVVESETIEVSEGAVVKAAAGVHLIADASVSGTPTASTSGKVTAAVSVNGTVQTKGDLLVAANAALGYTGKPAATLADLSLTADVSASAVLGAKSSITAAGIFVVADTDVRIEVERSGVERSKVTIGVTQKSEAGARGNAAIRMVDDASPTEVSVLFEATDATQLRSVIGVQDSVLAGSDASKDVWNRIAVSREARAYLGDGTGEVVVAADQGVAAPVVQVGALARDRATGGILSDFAGSKQAGTSQVLIQSVVESALAGAELDVAGLRAFALDASSVNANARQARNQGVTSTIVRIDTLTLRSKGEASFIAQDRSSWKAVGGNYTGELLESWYGVSTLPASLAGNDVQASVTVSVVKSTIAAAGLRSFALAAQSLESEIKLGKMGPLTPGFLGLTLGFDINIGTLRAWNTLNGGTGVSVDQTTVVSSSAIELAARDKARLKADTPTGANAPPDGDQEAVFAVNAVGRYFGDLGTFDPARFAGGEPTDTGKSRDTTVTVNASRLEATGAVAVDARASLVMDAIADALNEPGVSTAAAGLLAINRYRGGTRTEVAGRTGVASIKAGGTVSVIARDALKVSAEADTGRPSSARLQVGGILVFNDIKRDLSARIDALSLDGGALAVEAIDEATISATARGAVDANSSDPFDDWTQLAANGSVATRRLGSRDECRLSLESLCRIWLGVKSAEP
jgi:hypothetical protein